MDALDPSMQPLVSILLPVYNGQQYLQHSIDSVFAQTYDNWQLLCVDNASTDATPEILQQAANSDSRIKVVRNPETVSVIENHNVVATLVPASSKYSKILHADDTLVSPNCLSRMVELCETNPAIGLVSAWTQQGEQVKNQIAPHNRENFSGREIGQRTLRREIYPFLSPSCLMIRSELIRARPQFYNITGLHADLDTWLELLKSSDFGIVQETMVMARDHPDSVTQQSAKPLNTLIAAHLEMLVKHGPDFFTQDEYEATLRQRRDHYLTFLSRAWWSGHSAEFWQYHRTHLASLKLSLKPGELTLKALFHGLSRPYATARILSNRLFSAT